MVLLNRSARAFVCWGYAVVDNCLNPSTVHTVAKKLLTNWVPLSVNRYIDMALDSIQWSLKTFSTCVAIVYSVGSAPVSLE